MILYEKLDNYIHLIYDVYNQKGLHSEPSLL